MKHITIHCKLIRDSKGKLGRTPRATLTLIENTHSALEFGSREPPHKWQYEYLKYGTFLHKNVRMYCTDAQTHGIDFETYRDSEAAQVTHKLRIGRVGSETIIYAKDWPMIKEAVEAYNACGATQ